MAMSETQQRSSGRTGRPTTYEARFVDMAYRMTLLGATVPDLAAHFDVNVDTVYEWRSKHAEFSDAIARGRDEADSHVAHSLYHRAKGYSHPAEKIFCTKDGSVVRAEYTEHYPPDTMAASLWLRNRRPDLWRDKQDVDVTLTGRIGKLDDESRATRALELVRGLLGKPAIEATAVDVTPGAAGQGDTTD